MYQPLDLEVPTRLRIAALTGLAGLATAIAISGLTISLPRILPETGFHLAALIGAGIAGFVLADGLGRPGAWGAFRAACTALAMTLFGAWLGALLVYPPGVAPFSAGALGWIMLADAATENLTTVKLWAAAMLLLHLAAGRLRQTCSLRA